MSKFSFDIVLRVLPFEAESLHEAELKIDQYVDKLARVSDDRLSWEEVDWKVREGNAVVKDFHEPV